MGHFVRAPFVVLLSRSSRLPLISSSMSSRPAASSLISNEEMDRPSANAPSRSEPSGPSRPSDSIGVSDYMPGTTGAEGHRVGSACQASLQVWEQQRTAWLTPVPGVARCAPEISPSLFVPGPRIPLISCRPPQRPGSLDGDEAYDAVLLGKKLSKPVPLGEMVEFLVDLWAEASCTHIRGGWNSAKSATWSNSRRRASSKRRPVDLETQRNP